MGFANSIIHNAGDADEIVNDVFLSIWEKRELLQLDESLKNYLFTAVKNRCLNHLKKARLPFSEMPDEVMAVSNDAGALHQMEGREAEMQIQVLIDKLPTKCRQVFLLSRLYELSYKEIAAVMDITPKTVENQIGIALKYLKESLSAYKKA